MNMDVNIDEKIIIFCCDFWIGFWDDFRGRTASIFDARKLHFGTMFGTRENVKNSTAPRREHKKQGSGGSKVVPKSIQKRIKMIYDFEWILNGSWTDFGLILETKLGPSWP